MLVLVWSCEKVKREENQNTPAPVITKIFLNHQDLLGTGTTVGKYENSLHNVHQSSYESIHWSENVCKQILNEQEKH